MPEGISRLNARQYDVLLLLMKGLRNAEIGEQLRLSERTVESYVSQLFLIFDVTNRTGLAGLFASMDGCLTPLGVTQSRFTP